MDLGELAREVSAFTGKQFTWYDNAMVVVVGDGVQVYLEYMEEQDELYLYSHIASIPEERFERYAVSLLKANFFGGGTGGSAVLAYDAEECRLVLWDKLTLSSLDADTFKKHFSRLYLSKLYWADKMRRELLGEDPEQSMHYPASLTMRTRHGRFT